MALLHVLDSLVATPADAIGRIQTPTLLVMGAGDERAESIDELATTLPHATLDRIPGGHTTAATSPDLFSAVIEFLTGR